MIFISIVFAFFALALAVHFFQNTKWTWIVAPLVMFVFTYFTFRIKTLPMIILFIALLAGSILCVYIKHFLDKRK